MLYIQQSLGRNEKLIHIGQFHWMYTFMACMNIFWGVLVGVVIIVGGIYGQSYFGPGFYSVDLIGQVRELHPGVKLFAFMALISGLLQFARMMVVKATTEIVITTKRLVYKRGLVARYVGEMSIDRIEGVNVVQTILGRIFNYGRVLVRGMGVGEVVLPPMDDPIKFRKGIMKAKSFEDKERDA